jgi:hypothetical protein
MFPHPLKNVPKSDRDEDGANLAFQEIGLGNRSKTLMYANLTKCNLFADNVFIPHSVYTENIKFCICAYLNATFVQRSSLSINAHIICYQLCHHDYFKDEFILFETENHYKR